MLEFVKTLIARDVVEPMLPLTRPQNQDYIKRCTHANLGEEMWKVEPQPFSLNKRGN